MSLLLPDLVSTGILYGDYRVTGRSQSDTFKTRILNVTTGALITGLVHTGTLTTDALSVTNAIVSNQNANAAISAPNGGVSALSATFSSATISTLTATGANVSGTLGANTLSVTNTTTLGNTTTVSSGDLNVNNGSILASGKVHIQSTNDYNNSVSAALLVDGGANIKLGISSQTLNTTKATINTLTATAGATITGGATVDTLTVQNNFTYGGVFNATGGLSVASTCKITCPITNVPGISFNNAANTGIYTSSDSGASAALYLQNGGAYIGGTSAFKTTLSLLGGATSSSPITILDTTDANLSNSIGSLVLNGGLVSKKSIATASTITTTSTSPTSIATSGGINATSLSTTTATITSSLDYNPSTQAASLVVTGGAAFAGTVGAAKSISLNSGSLTIDAPSLPTSSNNAGTAFRIRNTNSATSTRLTLANTSSTAYESSLNLFALGLEDGSTTNYERLNLGVNNTGGYLTHVAGGSGVVRTFNVMNGSTFTTGGSLNLASTNDYVAATPTSASFFSSGGGSFSKSFSANTLTTQSSLSFPSTFSVYTAGAAVNVPTQNNPGATSSGNVLRIRSNDSTNTTAAVSIGNNAMASTAYESDLILNALGADINSTNYERLTMGVNNNGAYLNHSAGGTGTVRTLNVMNGSLFTSGGSLILNNANDVNATTPNATSLYTAGGAYVSKMIGLGGSTMTISSAVSATSSTQTGSTPNSNILRLRSNDATNSTTRLSVANTAMANNYYDSSIVLWSLGSSAASTNYERMIIGANNTGGYLSYLYGGTGVSRTFNILGGSTFSTNGSLQLNTSLILGTSNTVTRMASPSSTATYTLTEPTGPPTTSGMVLSSTTAGVQSWSYPELIYTGDGSSTAPSQLPQVVRLYVLTQTLNTTNGQIAFYLTNTGLSSGTPLGTFAGIMFAARASSQSNTATNGPFATEAYRGTNGVVADVLVSKTTTIAVGGTAAGLQSAPTGTIVTCFAWIY